MKYVVCVILVLAAYLLGNVSPAIILGQLKGVDIKKEGSGNAGTTNVLRVLGKRAALITLMVDVLKGVIAVLLGKYMGDYTTGCLCALAVFCGHIWPCFYKFNGGKGVATAFGVLLGVNWILALTSLAIVILGIIITKRMSVGSICAALLFPVICYFLEPGFLYLGIVMAAIIVFKHRTNIKRILKGEEPKLSFKK